MTIYAAVGGLAPGLKIGGTDISDHVKAIEVPEDYDSVEVTAMGATAHSFAAGLRSDQIKVTFFQDWASNKTDALVNPLLGASSTGATVVAYANGTTASGTAPSFTLVSWVQTYSPINISNPGEVSMTDVVFLPCPGQAISRGTA